jgi:hypothetical protein
VNQRIPLLIVVPHYAELLTLYKDREVRHYPAPEKYIGQRIAIYASKTAPDKSDLNRLNNFITSDSFDRQFKKQITGETRGAIVATAILESCRLIKSKIEYKALFDCHFAPDYFYIPRKTYFWIFKEMIPLDDPLKVDFQGPVIWSCIEAEKLDSWLD